MATTKRVEDSIKLNPALDPILYLVTSCGLQFNHNEVSDTSGGCGASFHVIVVSQAFSGKTLIQQHRIVHDAVGNELMKEIHAFTQKTYTPEKWALLEKK
ncbi:hypothetical protein HK096_005000 [Nowakowskiella sp. JEL0078]|nr:hypothetical protein HK096_005000 [Nowakowskiella sp. JEL0078]